MVEYCKHLFSVLIGDCLRKGFGYSRDAHWVHKELAVVLDKHKAGEIVVFMLLLVPEVKLDPPEDGITVLLNKVLFIVALDMTRLPVDVPNIDEGVGLVEGVNVGVLEPVIVVVVGLG